MTLCFGLQLAVMVGKSSSCDFMSDLVLTFCVVLTSFSCLSEIYPKKYFGKILRNEKHH